MAFLTFAILFAVVFSGVMVGRAQETTEPLFLDTTLLPVAELSIRNMPRPSTMETNPSPSIPDVSSPKETADLSEDIIQHQTYPITETSSVMEPVQNPVLHDSASVHFDLTSQRISTGLPYPSVPWDTSLMPSFTSEAVQSPSFTRLIPATVNEDAAASFIKISEFPTVTFSHQSEMGVSLDYGITAHANGDVMSSHTEAEKSNIGIQTNGSTPVSEISAKVSISEDTTAIPNIELTTSTSSFIFETESTSKASDMILGSGFDETAIVTTSPNATSTINNDSSFRSEVVVLDKTEQNQSHQDISSYSKQLIFVLKKRCSNDQTLLETFEELTEQLMKVLNSTITLKENKGVLVCDRLFHLSVHVKNTTDSVIRETIQNLTRNFTFGESFRVDKVYLYQNDHTKTVLYSADGLEQTVNNFDEYTLSERELIAYIVAGISLATLVFILLTCCCVRFLCKKQTTSLDLCDIPHLNLKLEDYKLTPIPRPTISFSEYGRELFNPSYNEHTPKLEDTILNQHHFATDTSSPGARESMSFPREMRTFGGKKSCSRVQSLDSRPNARSGNGWISNSREKLSSDFERRNSGFDNVAFRKWF